ncbi:MAG: chemotaxis protein CheD [Oscillospiraceae bacterium]|nr:chemotaxis protein CheD [Oscillospiraceae bacterium]
MGNLIVVGISDMKIASGDDMLITYALGSCVGTCLYDSTAKIIGLSHILLSDSGICPNDSNIYKFADTAIKELVRQMKAKGANQYRLHAKIAGGAQMFANSNRIGDKNIKAVIDELNKLGIKIVAHDVGENYGRTMTCHAKDGHVEINAISKGKKAL